jgi:hypothetical protein
MLFQLLFGLLFIMNMILYFVDNFKNVIFNLEMNNTLNLKSEELFIEDLIHKFICNNKTLDQDSGFFMLLVLIVFIIGKSITKFILRRNARTQ